MLQQKGTILHLLVCWWIIYSGATCHISAQKELFSELDMSVRGRVTVRKGI